MITIYNNFRTTIWATIEWFHPNCQDGGDWEKKGWWRIEPQQTALVWRGDHNAVNPLWYAYVELDARGSGPNWVWMYGHEVQ